MTIFFSPQQGGMDIEGFVRRNLSKGKAESVIIEELKNHILSIKETEPDYAGKFAEAVMKEVKNTSNLEDDLLNYETSGVSMGEFGVGSRGTGDFYAHRRIAEIIGKTGANVGVDQMDDAGVVEEHGRYIACTVDGMHSRLSDFPFLAGFHVTRATLRDCYVMGARPVMIFSDIHVADDGDVAKIFDYTAGIVSVSEVIDIPLVSGSTLRIGGDMVLGDRFTGCVGCVGVAEHVTARRETRPGDVLLMTEGAGGGTIATTALYSGYPEVVDSTINLKFLKACKALLESEALNHIHSMTDVTNGGLRGDVHEMAETAGCKIVIEEDEVRQLVEPKVYAMLEALQIDYLGVSLDALLIVCPPDAVDEITSVIENTGVPIRKIGYVEEGKPEAVLLTNGERHDFSPRFREAAYTPVKKLVDQEKRDFTEMKQAVDRATQAAIAKKNRVVAGLKQK